MKIDEASYRIVRLALFLNQFNKGAVSSIWIDKQTLKEINAKLPKRLDLEEETFEINSKITLLLDQRRKSYLNALLQSLVYQIKVHKKEVEFDFGEFIKKCFGVNIERVHEIELKRLEVQIATAESKLRMTRFEVIKNDTVAKRSVINKFKEKLAQVKQKLPAELALDESEEITVEAVSRKPWTAFINHVDAFKSEMRINLDLPHTDTDLTRLAVHEGYSGHHTELSLKDKLLLEGRGEHGLVITFSPQTYISEAIAESSIRMFDLAPTNRKQKLILDYDRLSDALLNLSAYWYFQDGLTKIEIKNKLMKFNISEDTRAAILRYATDDFWGKYAVVYYSAYDFLIRTFNQIENKQELLTEIYTQPTTPEMITSRYS